MHIEVSSGKISNYNSLVEYVNNCTELNDLVSLTSQVQSLLKDGLIKDPISASMLISVIQNKVNELNNNMSIVQNQTPAKAMTLTPVNKNNHKLTTSVSNKLGIASVVLLVANLGITTVMYAILAVSKMLG